MPPPTTAAMARFRNSEPTRTGRPNRPPGTTRAATENEEENTVHALRVAVAVAAAWGVVTANM